MKITIFAKDGLTEGNTIMSYSHTKTLPVDFIRSKETHRQMHITV